MPEKLSNEGFTVKNAPNVFRPHYAEKVENAAIALA